MVPHGRRPTGKSPGAPRGRSGPISNSPVSLTVYRISRLHIFSLPTLSLALRFLSTLDHPVPTIPSLFLLLTYPNHLYLFFFIFPAMSMLLLNSLIYSCLVLSNPITPHIHLSFLISVIFIFIFLFFFHLTPDTRTRTSLQASQAVI